MIMEPEFCQEIEKIYGNDELKLIQKAFDFANVKHSGQFRDTGDEYIIHPYTVAKILVENKADVTSIVCGLLHDCLEDTDCTEQEILDNFGKEVLNICEGFCKAELIKEKWQKNQDDIESLRKMFLVLRKDTRVIFVKLADRLHNMMTLSVKEKSKQIKIAKETLDIYVPLAERLGMNKFKHTLEDLCFKYLFPKDYIEVEQFLNNYYKKSEKKLTKIKHQIEKMAISQGLDIRIQSRIKSKFGVYKKSGIKGRENVFDIIATRIIVKEIKDCYTMLGLVHNMWQPVPGRIKDYIAKPKENLYMSLHTTVLYKTDTGTIPFEIQIRTEEMHLYCEYGMAAHWMYKEHGSKSNKADGNAEVYNMKKKMCENSDNLLKENESDEFLQVIKTGFYSNQIFVFTPDLKIIELPDGSIPIDFAYAIHTNLGNRCIGAKINGKMVPINTPLNTGDVVEVLTGSDKGPSRDWLKICKSRGAISKIKNYFKKEQREENIKIGKSILEEYAKRKGYVLTKLFEDKDTLSEIYFRYKLGSLDDIYASLGYGGITSAQVLNKFISKQQKIEKQEKKIADNSQISKSQDNSIIIDGHNDLLKKVAKCCNPIPGDDIVGYVSRGKGVTIHRRECPTLMGLENDRIVETNWNTIDYRIVYDATFKVLAKNQSGIVNSISSKIADNKVDITYIKSEILKTQDVMINVGVKIQDRQQLNEILVKIKSIPSVYDVIR